MEGIMKLSFLWMFLLSSFPVLNGFALEETQKKEENKEENKEEHEKEEEDKGFDLVEYVLGANIEMISALTGDNSVIALEKRQDGAMGLATVRVPWPFAALGVLRLIPKPVLWHLTGNVETWRIRKIPPPL